MTDDDARQEAGDQAIQEVIEMAVDDHASLVKRCLDALRMNGIPLDCETGSALQELGARIHAVIHDALATDDIH